MYSFGAKAVEILATEAAWRQVSLVTVSETAPLLPKTRRAGLAFVDPPRREFHTAREPLDQAALATGGPGEDESARVR
jgi:hypothetical protein